MVSYEHQAFTAFASEQGAHLKGEGQAPALYANMQVHPTEKMGAGAFEDTERRKLQQMSIMHGSHLAMRTMIERNIYAQSQRLGGDGSAFALQSHMGRMYTLDETDIYNDPRQSPHMDKAGIYSRVEKVYGL